MTCGNTFWGTLDFIFSKNCNVSSRLSFSGKSFIVKKKKKGEEPEGKLMKSFEMVTLSLTNGPSIKWVINQGHVSNEAIVG